MTFGEHINKIRVNKNLSLREAAKRSDISHPYLSQLETGKNKNPTPNIIRKLSKGLNVSYNDLMQAAGYGGKENPIPSDSFFDLFQIKNIEEELNDRGLFNSIEEYKELEYPDIEHFLNEKEVYYDKKRLNVDDKVMAKNILDTLFKDLEVNYPSHERIEKEYDKKIKTLEILKKRIERKKKKEGD